jgi:hypothetical protein
MFHDLMSVMTFKKKDIWGFNFNKVERVQVKCVENETGG